MHSRTTSPPWLLGTLLFGAICGCANSTQPGTPPSVQASTPEEAGHYLVLAGACNDCHTPGWIEGQGTLPASVWLTGSAVGYQGPWGTTYATNLRLVARERTPARWLEKFRSGEDMKPPMPWLNYAAMSDKDLLAIYHFIRHLGPSGVPEPADLPPGEEPKTPYIIMTPQSPNTASPAQAEPSQ